MFMSLVELITLLVILGLFVGIIIAIAKYNKKTLKLTKDTLAKKGLKQERLSCKQALANFVTKAFDFKSRAALSELWWVVLCVFLPINIIETIWPMIGWFLWLLFIIPFVSLYVRRFRDVSIHPIFAILIMVLTPIIEWIGKADFNSPWVLIFVLPGIIFSVLQIWVNFRASDPFDNKFGKIPNLVSLNKTKKIVQKTKKSLTDSLQKIYFNQIKNPGNIRLLFVLGIIFSFICMLIVYDNFSYKLHYELHYSVLNFLWVIFWFYVPFLVVFPIKFIAEGYKQKK